MRYLRRPSGRAAALICLVLLLMVAAGPILGRWRAPRAGEQAGGGNTPAGAASREPLRVVTSVHWLANIISVIGGDRITVVALMPPGADPHTFEAKPSQAASVAGADLGFAVGAGLDRFVDTLRNAANPSLPLTHLTRAIDAEYLIDGGQDPHLWLDPTLVRDHVLDVILDQLIAADPGGEAAFVANTNALAAELTNLDGWIEAAMRPLNHKGLITMHPAWAYFGRRYDLPVWAVQDGHGTEPSARYITELLEIAGELGINTLFREPNSPDLGLGAIVRSLGGQVMVLDPLGGPDRPGYSTYLELMRTNVSTIVRGLSID